MTKFALAAIAAASLMLSGAAHAQQPAAAPPPPLIDWDKIQIKTTDLGNKTYMLEGQGGNITVAVGTDGIIMVDGQFAPLSDKIKAAIKAISPLPVKYLINTHYHGDHTGGNANFAKDGVIIVAHDNIRIRLAAGTINGLTGAKVRAAAGGRAAQGNLFRRLDRGGSRRPQGAAHPCRQRPHRRRHLGLFRRRQRAGHRRHLQQPQALPEHRLRQWRRRARHDPRARHLPQGGERQTKIVPGHGPLATKADLVTFRNMLVTSHDRIKKLFDEGKTEQEVVALKPLADLDATWGNNAQHAEGHTRERLQVVQAAVAAASGLGRKPCCRN